MTVQALPQADVAGADADRVSLLLVHAQHECTKVPSSIAKLHPSQLCIRLGILCGRIKLLADQELPG